MNTKYQKKRVIVFNNSLHKMIELSGSERAYLDFILERMDSDNTITIDKHFRRSYIVFIDKITSGKRKITHATCKKAIAKLVQHQLLFRFQRGFYIVNPKHFTKATLKENKEHFEGMQEFLEETTEDKTLLGEARTKQAQHK